MILFVMISTLIFGCVQNGDYINDSESPPKPTISLDNSIPDELADIDTLNIYYLAYDAAKYYNLLDWQEYISAKLGLNILVNYNAFYASTLLKRSFDGVIYLNYQKTFPYEFNTTVFDYYDEEISYELSEYYRKYGWDKYIDPKYLSALTIDGSIYAVPTAINKYIVPRYYNKETLDELGLGVPQTVNEFHNYLINAKKLYIDDENYIPTIVPNHRFASSISDIARAYGIYFNNVFNSPVGFNPISDSIEDAVFSEDIYELLQFVRHLQDDKLMAVYSLSNRVNPFTGEELSTYITKLKPINKNFATEYSSVYSNVNEGFSSYLFAEKNYESVNGYYLKGNNDKFLCEIRNDMGFYVFPKSTKNIEGVIEAFNSQFTNPENYMDFKYGIMNEDYKIINDKITTPNLYPPNDGDFLELKLITNSYMQNSSNVPESLSIIETLENDIAYERNVFNHMKTYSQLSLNNIFNWNNNEGFEAIFNIGIPLDDAIEYYKSFVKRSGQIETIYELNERLGKVTTFDYSSP